MSPSTNYPSIKERDRTTPSQRVGVVTGMVVFVMFTGVFNLALWQSGYYSPFMILFFVFGVLGCPAVAVIACTKEYNGKIMILDRGGYCAQCQTDRVLERYQMHIGRRETGRDRDWLGRTRKIYYVQIWEERQHCLGCGLDCNASEAPRPVLQSASQQHMTKEEDPATEARNKAIFELLKTDQFREAEAQIRETQQQNLLDSFDMELLEFLDQALNGQGRKLEADAVADNLRKNWKRNFRKKWIVEGRPTHGSVHSRLILNRHNDYHVLAKQYYEPETQTKTGGEFSKAHFKILAFHKNDGSLVSNRLFKLEETVAGGKFVLKEHFTEVGRASEPVQCYGTLTVPDIREVAGCVVDYLGQLPVSCATVFSIGEDDDATVPVCDLEHTETTESPSSSDFFPEIV